MKLDSVLFVLTDKCSVGCHHCGFTGMARDGEFQLSELLQSINQAAAWGVPSVLFTGGEPFDRLEVLIAAVHTAYAAGLRCGVFTSSCWASSYNQAHDILSQLTGLSRITLSTDVYHQRRVPVKNVYNAINAAIALGISDISLNITFATDQDRFKVASQYECYDGRVRIYADRVIPTPHLKPGLLTDQDSMRSLAPNNYSSRCWVGTPLVNHNGDLFACHMGAGSTHEIPYFLGDLRACSFSAVMANAERRMDYQFLRTHGPRGVAELVRANPVVFSDIKRTTFTTDCDMCRSVLIHPGAREALVRLAESRQDEITVRRVLILREAPQHSVKEEL